MSKSDDYQVELERLQLKLVEAQAWAIDKGVRTLMLFEGRDAAGKDGSITRLTEYMSPRQTRVIALPKPSERESSQWYFQRYVPYLPAAGETIIFNRSWYNRGGVEPVMGFCTPEQHATFLTDTPIFERMLVDDGVRVVKLWLDISRKEQAERLDDRRSDPLKTLKVSPLDAVAQEKWDDYSKARDEMLSRTHSPHAPWFIVHTDKKTEARSNIIRHILKTLAPKAVAKDVAKPDPDILFEFDTAALSDGRLER